MIFELSSRFQSFKKDDWHPYRRAIENLLTVHGQGWHMFSPSRETASSINDHCELSGTQIDILRYYIIERSTTLTGQARSADHTVLCVAEGGHAGAERQGQIALPLLAFSDLSFCGKSKLITENSEVDGRLIELLADEAGRELGYAMPLSLQRVHGGGGSTGACYRACLASDRSVVCVTDSDKRYSKGPHGVTAKEVTAAHVDAVFGTSVSFTLPVRELENALPLSALLEVYANTREVLGRVSNLIGYLDRCSSSRATHQRLCLDFLDLKEGIRSSDLAKLPPEARAEFVSLINFSNVRTWTADDFDDIKDNTILVHGVSQGMLSQVLEYLIENRAFMKTFLQKLKRSPSWVWLEELLRTVLAFGAAGEKLPFRL